MAAFLAFPASFAYAVLRHRLFDVRVIVRQGLQYAMARGVLLSALPVLVVAFVIDIFIHRRESLATITADRGLTYAGFASAIAILYSKRQQWLDRIDRAFFRDRYDPQRLLQQLVQSLPQAENLDAAGAEVVNRIERALHPEFVSLLHCRPDQTEFRPIASEPAHRARMRLRGDMRLIGLLRVVEKPLQFSGSTWLTERLPGEEIRVVEQEHTDLIVPIKMGPDSAESLLVLGPKRSEEPYSQEDKGLLTAIAASLALLSRAAAPERPYIEGFRECPSCGVCFNLTESNCHEDGSTLVRIDMSRRLANRYRLDRRIGRGGMGTVYAGVDETLQRAIAVKMIRAELVEHPQITARFQDEARAAAGLVHRNVVTIYDFGIERRHPFIVMELLAGRTLRAEFGRATPFPPPRATEILEGVCAAIKEAHRHQLLHRDLKPENIFLAETPTGEVVKVLDFGLAKVIAASPTIANPTVTGNTIVGTPYYMAPEQLTGAPLSPCTDVWALGVIAYEMLAGAHPFVTGATTSWQNAILNGRFTPIHVHRSAAPEEWHAFFERVFEPDPKLRTPSSRVFLTELQRALRAQHQKSESAS